MRFRTIPINTELRAFDDAVDVYMIDPRGFVVRRWLSRQVRVSIISLPQLCAYLFYRAVSNCLSSLSLSLETIGEETTAAAAVVYIQL